MNNNLELFNQSKKVLVGGVNSPVRAMKPDYPFFVTYGHSCYLVDVEGNKYIDYCLGYGPLIFGHAREEIVEAIQLQLEKGTLYGTPTELELKFAQEIISNVPNVEMIRLVNTGTEATMAAIRLARGFTDRPKFIKFNGGYHGAHDGVLVKAGSGALTHSIPDSGGIPPEIASHTLLSEFNEIETLVSLFDKFRDQISCVIIEPVMGNIGCVLPEKNFLLAVQKLCSENDALLIFDEVITGFRLGSGGAQKRFGIDADIITMGKIIGGGLPIGVFGGKREIMENIAPQGRVYNAGTFNGNPMTVTAGLIALKLLKQLNPYSTLEKSGNTLRKGLQDIFPGSSVQGISSMFCMYMSESEINNYREALEKADKEKFLIYQRQMLKQGVFHPPSQYECNFLSTAHSPEIIHETLEKAKLCKL